MLRSLMFTVSLAVPAAALAQVHEAGAGGGLSSSSNSGYEGSVVGASVFGQLGLGSIDVGASHHVATFPKRGTPGGHSTVTSVWWRDWMGRNMFLSVGASWFHGDATVWTKNVTFVDVSGGFRWKTAEHKARPNEETVFAGYEWEEKSDALHPNRGKTLFVGWRHDHHLNARLALRQTLAFSRTRFLQSGDWWNSNGVSITYAVVFRGRE
ncbi:MAG TPA: hypothetical protein VD862_00240 [Candidatus Paceibacterota bacterium]|nr:hypothetical protein [Candidatus Paceibacterota bacterium]